MEDTNRRLATVQLISELHPIDGSDFIEHAVVLGWHIIVKKGEFQVGSKCVFFEIDSVTKNIPQLEFMSKYRYRVKTMKMRGVVSQGLAIPLEALNIDSDTEVDTDLTDVLKVEKWEPYQEEHNQVRGPRIGKDFPLFIFKTDENRIQTIPRFLKDNYGMELGMSEKLDGTSSTFFFHHGNYGVCSRNLLLHDIEKYEQLPVYYKMSQQYDIERKLRELNRNIAIQGETIGSGIQGNKYKYDNGVQELFVFYIFDTDRMEYLSKTEMIDLCEHLELKTVPQLGTITLNHSVDEFVEISRGKSVLNPSMHREGIVFSRLDKGIKKGFKVINPDFLLKYDE